MVQEMKMSRKLVLIDGHSILSRAFYGIPELTNGQGLHTNAVYGFLNIMLKFLEDEKATHLAVAFDMHAPTFRHRMYEAYKGTRKGVPEEFREQVPVMQELLRAMGIPLLMLEGYEADDLIGTAAKKFQKEGMEVTILSGDRDLLQLADSHIRISLPKTVKGVTTVNHYYPEEVIAEWQVTPQEFIDLKALMGDTSDNIPGIAGFGPKSAQWIIGKYHTIEAAHEAALMHDPAFAVPRMPRAAEMLINNWDSAVLSKKLATIDIQAPISITEEDTVLHDIFTPEAYEIVSRLELKSILRYFSPENFAEKEAPAESLLGNLKSVDDPFLAEIIFKDAENAGECGFVVKDGVYLALPGDRVYYFRDMDTVSQLERLKKLPGMHMYTIDLKSQLKAAPFEDAEGLYDLALGAYVLNPTKDSFSASDIARDFLGLTLREKIADDTERKAGEPELPLAEAAVIAEKAGGKVLEAIAAIDASRLYQEIEMPLLFTLSRMEKNGIRVDREALVAYGKELEAGIESLQQEIYRQAGTVFNINSPKQLGELLFETMGLKGGKKTKSGYSTAADVLEKLAADVPFVRDILEYRTLTKLNSTYAQGLLSFIREDGRIHGEFNQMVTATGRISSANPNLQNIPIRTELGRRFRKVFVPEEGCLFVDADYSQVELRILAALSGDEKLIGAYREASDIHAVTASQVFHVPLDEVTPQLRRNAKAVNFGIVYGISAFGLSEGLSITRKEAKEYIERYFETYPGVKRFLDEQVALAGEQGYVTTYFGRRRPVPDIRSSNFVRRSFSERVAMNSPIQGTAADIMKIAMNGVDRRLKREGLKSRIVVQVHDELLLEAPRDEVEKVKQLLKEEMENAVSLAVQLKADTSVGVNWDEAH